jgi:hypothetical protein
MRVNGYPTRHRKGYLLLTVIAVSVMVLTSLAALARHSLRRGLEAADAERSLQQRWGAITLERALLEQAPLVFEQQQELVAKQAPGSPTPTTVRALVQLRDARFDVLLGDEDTKLNVNAVYHVGGLDGAGQAIGRIGGPAVQVAIRLIAAVPPLAMESPIGRRENEDSDDAAETEEPAIPDAFRSWGEVFDLKSLDAGVARDASLPNLTTGLTCWGSGQLNVRRASDEAILAIIGLVVQDGAARRILERYRKNPNSTLAVLLQTEVTQESDRQRLSRLLSESSLSFSVWIDASSRGAGSLRSFTVMRRDEEGVIRQIKFLH